MTKFIMEYRYQHSEAGGWLYDNEYESAASAHWALVEHVEEYKHIEVRVRKVETVDEVVGHFKPISSEEYDDE
jgi:hypothetical protein